MSSGGVENQKNKFISILGRELFDDLMENWYEKAVSGGWRYVVFVVRRSYILALILERFSNKKMTSDSSTTFLTDSSIVRYCDEIADFYEEHGFIKVIKEWNIDQITVKFKSPVKMHLLNGKVAFTKGPITLARDCRLDDIEKPLNITAKDGKNVSAKIVKNINFYNNVTVSIKTNEGNILFCDYSSAGKNYDDDNCQITVWQKI